MTCNKNKRIFKKKITELPMEVDTFVSGMNNCKFLDFSFLLSYVVRYETKFPVLVVEKPH